MASETGKQRAQRIQIDYFRKKDGLSSWKSLCIIVGLAAGAAYSIYVLATPSGAVHVSTGPVATPHAHFESDCGQCHQDFTPISSDASRINLQSLGVSSQESLQHTESACQACHRVGKHHQADLKPDWQPHDQDCASCHADHQGRSFDLTAVANASCTVCHANLNAACAADPKRRSSVTGFTLESHGEFRSLSEAVDRGRVKFDHAQHLMPGQVEPGQIETMRLSSLPPAERERYRKTTDLVAQSDDDLVQLMCADCHEPSGNSGPGAAHLADRELGRNFAPVSFEKHCQACHAIRGGVGTEGTAPLPHAAPWSDISTLLAANFVGARATGRARAPGDDSQQIEKPGDGLGQAPSSISLAIDGGTLDAARERVEAECLKCHEPSDISDQGIENALTGKSDPIIPDRWLRFGLYDHATHASIACDECHSGVRDLGDNTDPRDQDTIMISNIESCVGCHRDADVATPAEIQAKHDVEFGGMPVWASSDCILCHRYHPTDPQRAQLIQAAQIPRSSKGSE